MKVGDKFNRWTIVAIPDPASKYVTCQCECGKTPPRPVRADVLKNGRSKSCGCLQKESTTTHGLWKHPLYRVWASMMDRCYEPTSKDYLNYAGKGITVCEQWHDVHAFIKDVEHLFKSGSTLDRIDNTKGYYPGNVRFASRTEQARNRDTNINITYRGETHCLKEWSRILGIPYITLHFRVVKSNWSIEEAFSKKRRPYPKQVSSIKITAFGETHDINYWARKYGISRQTLYLRISRYNMAPETALTKPLRSVTQHIET